MKEYSLKELKCGLDEGRWTSVDLVEMYIDRITTYDSAGPKINSIAEINPDVYQIAMMLDYERNEKGPRSPIHGIPLVVKDNILTKDKMHTTAGSVVLKDYYGIEDAFIIKKLRDAGAILLGKTNLSEFAYFMSYDDMPSGYGGNSGQVKSPYSSQIDPLGSSTGSAVSVACNFIPVSIGTETNGSLTAPALMSSIQTIKPTMGLVSRTGIIPISHHQDIAGPMARTIEDLGILLDVISGYDPDDVMTAIVKEKTFDFSHASTLKVKNKRIGFLAFTDVEYTKEEKMIETEAKQIFIDKGFEIVNLSVKPERIPNFDTLTHDFKVSLNAFMDKYMKDYHVHSLKDIIEFNKQDPQIRMRYGQSIFEASEKTSGTLRENDYHVKYQENIFKANLITRLVHTNHLSSVVSVKRTSYAPIAGNPVVGVVAKALVDNAPMSLYFIGDKFSDAIQLRLAYIYEQATHKRMSPDLEHIRT